jgi:transcriptional regulator with XRE-family HTH domain
MLSNIERGQRKPETQLLINIASTLGVPDGELLNLTAMGENKKQMAPPGGNR